MDNERTKFNRIKEAHSEWSFQDVTQRLKSVHFSETSHPSEVMQETENLWETATQIYSTPLVQVRAVLAQEAEVNLLGGVDRLTEMVSASGFEASARVAGRIPFRADSGLYSIYYIHLESSRRPSYKPDHCVSHENAVLAGYEKGRNPGAKPLPGEYSLYALDFSGEFPIDILSGETVHINRDLFCREVSEVHKLAFEFPHDPSQQTPEGVREIINNNPVLVALDELHHIASVGFLERDDRFTFEGISLVEPTYFSHPEHGNKGLSSHLRQTTQRLADMSASINLYNNMPLIIFNESIRHTSFKLCIENGGNLAGSIDSPITGNLGDAYTAIGPANPETGYMPMGLTYFISQEIET